MRSVEVARRRHPAPRPGAQPQPQTNAARDYDQRKYDNEKLNYLFEDDEEDAK